MRGAARCTVATMTATASSSLRVGGTCTLASASAAPVAAVCALSSRRYFYEHKTKGAPYMKHLDVYARRDVQLAPYLLREVDVEYKRRCRKVQFVLWLAICVAAAALQLHMEAEELHYMRLYAVHMRAEQQARDRDQLERRRVFAQVLDVVGRAFDRDQRWTREDARRVAQILHP